MPPFTLPPGEEFTASLVVIKPFKFAHLGLFVQEFEPASEAQPMTAACAEVALAERWARKPSSRATAAERATAAATAAPEQQALMEVESTAAATTAVQTPAPDGATATAATATTTA